MFKKINQDYSTWQTNLTRVFIPLFFLSSCAMARLPKSQIVIGGNSQSLKWEQMVNKTLQRNPDILAARADITSGKYARNIAAGDFLPEVNGVLNRSQLDTPTEKPSQFLSVGIEATQNLFSGWNTTGETLKAHRELQAANWAYRETSSIVRFRLRSAYIELLKFQKLLEVSKRIAERRKENADLIRLRYEAGREHLGSSLRASAILEQAQFEIRQTERRIQNQALLIGKEMGGDFDLGLSVPEVIDGVVLQETGDKPDYVKYADENPSVQRLVKTAEAAKAFIISSQSSIWPTVDGTWDHTQAGSSASDLKKETFLGLRVQVPFFNGGENVQGILKAKADYDSALQAARSTRDEVITQLSQAWSQYMDAMELVKVQKSFLVASEKRSEIVRAQYSSGLSNFQEFDIAERDFAESEKSYVQSMADALSAEANWQFVKGLTLEDDLRES